MTRHTPSEPVSTRDDGDSALQGDSQVWDPPPKSRPIQRSSGRPSKKRKADQVDGDDETVGAFLHFYQQALNISPARKSRCFTAA
jgi:hypothetical protein